ncbi:hypothetical protein [Leptospira sp. GIMC2001]|uniref:hypothetical protein n=1 Tax=Leptospira sp. GIMC2001 TaxID=1513297 RepID=UPI0023496B91|nr:hypothetical protein [Leptospira sp. GIMC2001]WCL50392.1 hypothetical protein O4O04_06120 [Leptospira sp. GIMC2001]
MKQLLITLLLFSSSLFAEELKKGDVFPELQLEDTSETARLIPSDTKKIFFISDMTASKVIHTVLSDKPNNFLSDAKSVLISDIHKMPSLITRFVALPKMKGYSYPILLIRDDKTGSLFPHEKEKISYLRLYKGKIVSIQFLETIEDLEKALSEK